MDNRYIYLPDAIFKQRITDKELKVYALFLERAQQEGNHGLIAVIKYSDLAERMGHSLSTAVRAVRSLEKREWIAHIRGIYPLPNQYLLLLKAAGKDVFPFPVAAIKAVSGSKLLVLACLCSCAAAGTALPSAVELGAALHVQPGTVRKCFADLRTEEIREHIPHSVVELFVKDVRDSSTSTI